jgi:hypothetical protein
MTHLESSSLIFFGRRATLCAALWSLLAAPVVATAHFSQVQSLSTAANLAEIREGYRRAGWTPLVLDYKSTPHGFNNSGDQSYQGESSATANIATIAANGQLLSGPRIGPTLFAPYVMQAVDPKFPTATAIRLQVATTHEKTSGAWRTQVAGYPIEPYKRYAWLLVFRLDDSWDVNAPDQVGLLWQLKGRHKPGQYGNPAFSFNLDRNELSCAVSYPTQAMKVPLGSAIRWGPKDYDRPTLPTQVLLKGNYHALEFEFFADDRPTNAGGQGYIKAKLDGIHWFEYAGPTLQPDLAGPHQPIWGWYQWQAKPMTDRVIWWLANEGYAAP